MRISSSTPNIALLVIVMAAVSLGYAQQKSKHAADMKMSDMSTEEMNKRGDRVMGFNHTKTTHHFRLLANGGSIAVSANRDDDKRTRDQIRMHLRGIAKDFAAGNFNDPMLIHEQVPPGAEFMEKLKDQITYNFEETDRGAAVRISTDNAEALQAIHAFLRFQIKEHKTGDSLELRE